MAGWPWASNRLATRGATHRDWGVGREKRERRRGREGERGKGEGVARPGAAKRTLGCPLVLRTSELPCTLRAASRLSQSPRVTTVSSLASYPGLVVRPGPGADPLVLIAIVKERRVDLPDARHVGHTTEISMTGKIVGVVEVRGPTLNSVFDLGVSAHLCPLAAQARSLYRPDGLALTPWPLPA